MAGLAEAALGLPPRSAAVMSTGVIGPRLPMDKIAAGIQQAAGELSPDGWDAAAHAIMTTDTRPKMAFREIGGVRIFGMCKGAGMIHPNMATMLAMIVTDAAVEPDAPGRAAARGGGRQLQLHQRRRRHVHERYGAAAGERRGRARSWKLDSSTPLSLCLSLLNPHRSAPTSPSRSSATARARPSSSRSGLKARRRTADARMAAKAVANSPLVKTAFYGGDANWGRILAAVGYSGAAVDPSKADLWIAPGTDTATRTRRHGDTHGTCSWCVPDNRCRTRKKPPAPSSPGRRSRSRSCWGKAKGRLLSGHAI